MNIKQIITVGIAGMAMGVMALNGAEVSNVRARQRYPWNGKVDIDCALTGTAGTAYALTVTARDKIGGTNLTVRTVNVEGDPATGNPVSVTSGVYRLVWDADADLPNGYRCEKLSISVSVTDNAKKFMIVDLSSGAITYQSNAPEGGWDVDEYKGTKMAFVRIEPGVFTQYSVSNMPGRTVTMTRPYYMGVLPVTHKHLRTLAGSSYGGQSFDDSYEWFIPKDYNVGQYGYSIAEACNAQNVYRGTGHRRAYGSARAADFWPSIGHAVASDSPIGVLRSRTGNEKFDLPTEAGVMFAKDEIAWNGYTMCLDPWQSWLGVETVENPQGEIGVESLHWRDPNDGRLACKPYSTCVGAVAIERKSTEEIGACPTRFCVYEIE